MGEFDVEIRRVSFDGACFHCGRTGDHKTAANADGAMECVSKPLSGYCPKGYVTCARDDEGCYVVGEGSGFLRAQRVNDRALRDAIGDWQYFTTHKQIIDDDAISEPLRKQAHEARKAQEVLDGKNKFVKEST